MYEPTNATLPASQSGLPERPERLPERWVDKLFDEMAAMYGSRFADLWAGTDLDKVKAKWAEKLVGFFDKPKAISEALRALDDKPMPPNLPEFLALCREAARRQGDATVNLGYTPTPEERERAAEVIDKAAKAVKREAAHDYRSCAKKLKARHEAGEDLSPYQVDAYREALSADAEDKAA